jgi:hypothetical protein
MQLSSPKRSGVSAWDAAGEQASRQVNANIVKSEKSMMPRTAATNEDMKL